MKLNRIPQRLQPLTSNVQVQEIDANSWRWDKQSSSKRGYGHKWRKARERFLAEHPLCVYCQREGRVTAANVVDHIKQHRGDKALFWDKTNWMSLCKFHHDSTKQKEESRNVKY